MFSIKKKIAQGLLHDFTIINPALLCCLPHPVAQRGCRQTRSAVGVSHLPYRGLREDASVWWGHLGPSHQQTDDLSAVGRLPYVAAAGEACSPWKYGGIRWGAGILLCMRPANETTLHCNDASHWLGTYTKWSLEEDNHVDINLNSLWPGDTMWPYRTGSKLAQVMAYNLMAPSHYLNQGWLIDREIHGQSPEDNFY